MFWSGLVLCLLLNLAGCLFTIWLVARLWRLRSRPAQVPALVLAAATMYGAANTVIGVTKAVDAVGSETIDVSRKARILAEGISQAMNFTAMSVVVWVAGAVLTWMLVRGQKGTS